MIFFINPDSTPLVFWWVMITKNVDWINYMYYNKQGFVNKTRDAVMGISEQLSATSLMTWQNRLALDVLLAERVASAEWWGNNVLYLHPKQHSSRRIVTMAMAGLTTLAHELAENFGVDTSLTSWFDNMFGQWKNVMITVLWATFTCMTVLVLLGVV
uniref:Uncharacterized protein n=1 Tax=Hucho hucho TaxID=62062 RepID=A0A4W5M4Z3_9TELE